MKKTPKISKGSAAPTDGGLRAKISIKGILIFAISVLIVPTMIIYSVFCYTQTRNGSEAAIEETLPTAVRMAAQSVTNDLGRFMTLAKEIASEDTLLSEESAAEDISSFLKKKVSVHGMLGLYAYAANGAGANGDNASQESFFAECISGKTVVEEPVLDGRFGQMSITIATPIWKNGVSGGSPAGVLACVIPLSALNDTLAELKLSTNSTISVIDRNGVIIGDNDVTKVEKSNNLLTAAAAAKNTKNLTELVKKAMAGENGVGRYSYEGRTMYAAYAPISDSDGWSVFVSAPESDFDAQVKKTELYIAILIVCFILYSIFGLSVAIPKITRPLAKLVTVLRHTVKFLVSDEVGIMKEVQPIHRLIAFFKGDVKFVYEVGRALCEFSFPYESSNSRTRSEYLVCKRVYLIRTINIFHHVYNAFCKNIALVVQWRLASFIC